MRKQANKIRMRDYDFARVMGGIHGEDITEWFSDNDVYLSDILDDGNIGSFRDTRIAGRTEARY